MTMKTRSFRILGAALAALLPACGGGNGSGGGGSPDTGGGTGNQAPTVTLLEPSLALTLLAPATIPLLADAVDPDGSVVKVDFLQGTAVVGTATQAPFQATWADVPAGVYSLTAVATDNLGAQTTSNAITITVLPEGWTTITSFGQEMSGLWFADAAQGWVVGADGVILHSVDGGATWVPQASGTSQWLRKVQFIDTMRGWLVGEGGTVLRTTDGGTNWIPSPVGTDAGLVALSFVDSDTGWVVGGEANVFATNDGGVTWRPQPTGFSGFVFNRGVRFVDRLNGWVLCSTGSAPGDVILHTTDGGLTWTEQFRTEHATDRFAALDFVSATTGWVSRESGMQHRNVGIWHTTDAGTSWTEQTYEQGLGIFALDFVSPTHGWGVGGAGLIIHTEDGGASWEILHPQGRLGDPDFRDLRFLDINLGWALRSDGVLLKTTTGGKGS